MITVVYTNQKLIAYGHGTPSGLLKLVDAELAGRSYPMTSTTHVFLNTIINRYKDAMGQVFYPISVNLVFPNQAYFETSQRRHLMDYILERKDVLKLRERKCLMQATIDGWAKAQNQYLPAWTGLEIEEKSILGIKEGRSLPLQFKPIKDIGRTNLHQELQTYAEEELTVQEAVLVSKLQTLGSAETKQLFNAQDIELKFAENEEIPDTAIAITESFRAEILMHLTNRIFLHINNLYSKLPSGKPVFFIGSLVNNPSICDSIKNGGLKFDYQTVFIKEDDIPRLSASSFSPSAQRQGLSPKQPQISTAAEGTIANDTEVKQASSPQSQTLNIKDKAGSNDLSSESSIRTQISKEFVIEDRFKNQEFLLFRGYKKNSGTSRYYRFISHKDYKQIDRKANFIKLYKKVQLMYPEISTLVNATAGKYYYLDNMGAKPLSEVIARSRLKKGGRGKFKSEDIQLLIDIYQKLEELPITFSNLSTDNIYIRQKEWWRSSGTNEVYFLGISAEDSTKEDMTQKLNEILQSLVHPAVFEHINNT